MKVVHLISSGGMYGAESVILNLCMAINATGQHSSALAVFANTAQPNLQLRDVALTAGIETHTIECRGQLDSSVPGRVLRLAETIGADVVHTHGYKADIYAWWGLRRSGISLVATCHNWLDNDMALRSYGFVDRAVLRRFDRIAAVSYGVRSRLLAARVAAERISLIRNGISLKPFDVASSRQAAPDQQICTIGLVGRLSREKRIDAFIRTAGLLSKDFPSSRFLIAGDGPEKEDLETLIHELGLTDRVRLLGQWHDMPSLYASFDVLVIASETEGLPMVLLEGMASGLPVVATAVGEIPAVVQEGETGILVRPGDDAALTGAVSKLLMDSALRLRMGRNARARAAAEFSADRMAADYIKIYREAAACRRGPA